MLESLPVPSPILFWGFVVLPLAVVGAVVAAVRYTLGAGPARLALLSVSVWMGLTAYLASAGHLDAWGPPRIFLVIVPMLIWLAWAARRPWTERLGGLPLPLLVGFQSFRVGVEGLLHLAVSDGIANPTMTWSGTNFDIVAGVSALLLAPFASRIAPRLLQVWNVVMAGVLVVTAVTAALAAPSPFRQIMSDPPNGFVAGFPFVWLPSVLVLFAWLGHVVLFRRLAGAVAAGGAKA